MRSSAPFIPKGFEPLAGGKRSATPGMDAPQTSAPQRGASMSRCCDPFGIGRATRAVIRWYRFAQPPANSCNAFGIGIGIAFGISIGIAFGIGIGIAFGIGIGIAFRIGIGIAFGIGLGIAFGIGIEIEGRKR